LAFFTVQFRHFPYGVGILRRSISGFLKDYTGSIWTPIIAHAVSNFVVLLYLRYGLKEAVKRSRKSS